MKKIVRYVALAVVFLIALSGSGCSFSVSTANLTDASMATAIDENGKPTDSVSEYSQDAAEFVAYAILNNAPDGTSVRFVWTYTTEDQLINEYVLDAQGQSEVYVFSSLTSEELWPVGDYSVECYVDEREKPDATIIFSVK